MTRRRKSRRNTGARINPAIFTGLSIILAVAVLFAGAAVIEKRQAEALGGVISQTEESEYQEPAGTKVAESSEVGEGSGKSTDVLWEERKEELKNKFSGSLRVSVEEDTIELNNPVEQEIERLAKNSELSDEALERSFDYEQIEKKIREQVTQLAEEWNRKPIDSVVLSFDKTSGVYEYSKGENGRLLDQERLSRDLMEIVRVNNYDTPAKAVFSVTAARTREQAREQYQVIGTFTTKLTDNKNRNKNVSLAANAIDGRILKPGEEFSFNETTGNRTSEKGYQPAGAYRNGILIEEPGGGVCQVSTTLYHAIIKAGFKTTERNAHSFAPTYVEKGQDAMVSFDGYAGPDLKFVNTGSSPVVLRASVQGKELKLSIVGLPVLEEGVKVSIRSEKIRDVEQTEPAYVENPELPFGSEKVVESGTGGSVWKSYRVVSKNGETLKEEPLHNSYYKSKAGKIERNTTQPQSQEPPQAEGGEITESQSDASSGQEPSADPAGTVAGETGEGLPSVPETGMTDTGVPEAGSNDTSTSENGSEDTGAPEVDITGPALQD